MKPMSPDEAFVEIMLGKGSRSAKEARVSALAQKVRAAQENRVSCPECGSEGPHEDNGETGSRFALCCTSCGTHFEPDPISF